MQLVIHRNSLADLLDCYLDCGCSTDRVRCQIMLDKVLYDTDRSIDLYAFGVDDFGEPERRASAYAFVIDVFLQGNLSSPKDYETRFVLYSLIAWVNKILIANPPPATTESKDRADARLKLMAIASDIDKHIKNATEISHADISQWKDDIRKSAEVFSTNSAADYDWIHVPSDVKSFLEDQSAKCLWPSRSGSDVSIDSVLRSVRDNLRPTISTSDLLTHDLLEDMEEFAQASAEEIRNLVKPPASLPIPDQQLVTDLDTSLKDIRALLAGTSGQGVTLQNLFSHFNTLVRARNRLNRLQSPVFMPSDLEGYFSVIKQELCLQERGEFRWRRLVESMAPSCLRGGETLDAVEAMLGDALRLIGGTCDERELTIPPDVDTSLDNLVNGTNVLGQGRWP